MPDANARTDARPELRRLDRTIRSVVYVAVLISLAYPWYAHWVELILMERELAAMTRPSRDARTPAGRPGPSDPAPRMDDPISQFGVDVAHGATRGLRESIDNQAKRQMAEAGEHRLEAVEVAGAIDGAPPTLIVELGRATLDEARLRICAQAATVLRRPLVAGETLRIQRHRGDQPARDVGSITCAS